MEYSSDTESREDEGLVIPIFPLPNAVLFPRTLMPLHIFEPRYRAMVSESLEAEQPIGIVLLQPSSGSESKPSPEVFSVGSMGEIFEHRDLGDGRYDIVVSGERRFEIVRFVNDDRPYRRARVRLLPESLPDSDSIKGTHRKLLDSFLELMQGLDMEQVDISVVSRLDFATLVNTICAALQISPLDRQQLLEIDQMTRRSEAALRILEEQLNHKRFLNRFGHLRPEDSNLN